MKTYLLFVEETSLESLRKVMPQINFVEVAGLNVKEFPDSTFLTTPFVKPPEKPVEEKVSE